MIRRWLDARMERFVDWLLDHAPFPPTPPQSRDHGEANYRAPKPPTPDSPRHP